MLPADMGGGSGAPVAPIAATQYDFDRIKELATKRGDHWKESAAAGHAKLAKIELDHTSFSQIPSCQRFGTTYVAAHQIYLDTLEGVKKDVAEYQAKLLKVAESMRLHDDHASDVFAGFNQSSDHTSFAGDSAYDQQSRSDAANRAEDAQHKAQDEQRQIETDRALEEERRAQAAAANAPHHGAGPSPSPATPAPSAQPTPQPSSAQDASGRAAVG